MRIFGDLHFVFLRKKHPNSSSFNMNSEIWTLNLNYSVGVQKIILVEKITEIYLAVHLNFSVNIPTTFKSHRAAYCPTHQIIL